MCTEAVVEKVFITAQITSAFISLSAVHIYDFHIFTTIYSSLHWIIWSQYNDQLPVGLLAQLMERCSGIAEVVVQILYRPEFFFRPYLHYCLSSVHFWGDHFHIQFVLLLLCNIQIFLFRLEIVENDEGKNILEHPDYFEVHKLFTLKDLFNANVHLGHNEGCWDPLMKPYLFGVREKHHIIDLNQTVVHLRVCTCIMRIKG